jgi:hypothetical protein
MAAYHHVRDYRDTPGFLLIQHGSYQWISLEDQPSIRAGEVWLYRGIGRPPRVRCLRFRPEELSPANGEIWRKYLRVQAGMLSDSILSFNTIHDRVKRCETAGLRDGTCVGDELATQAARSTPFWRSISRQRKTILVDKCVWTTYCQRSSNGAPRREHIFFYSHTEFSLLAS